MTDQWCIRDITTAQIHHVDNARIFGGNDTREMELRLARHRDRSPLHTTRGLDPSQQRGSKTQAIIQDRKGMRDWISSLLRISRASPRNTQKGSPPATHCHIDRIHGHNPRRIDAVRNGPHFQRSGGHAVTQSSNIDELASTPVFSEASLL